IRWNLGCQCDFVFEGEDGIILSRIRYRYSMTESTPAVSAPLGKTPGKISVVPMITATYFMVAGGPYGLEEIVQKTGYTATLIILLVTPLLWSLPTALQVSELATAIPEEGGFYVWVRRGLGNFMGYQEGLRSLAGSRVGNG